jgi:hypothetical protein
LRPFGFLAPRFCLTKSGSKKTKEPKQDSQNRGARKSKGLNRVDKIWEQENQRASTGQPKSGSEKTKGPTQGIQNLGARKPKSLNRIDKI